MAMYFCPDHQGFVDDDWHPMDERGLCPDCSIKREEAMRDFVAEQVGNLLREAESREQGI